MSPSCCKSVSSKQSCMLCKCYLHERVRTEPSSFNALVFCLLGRCWAISIARYETIRKQDHRKMRRAYHNCCSITSTSCDVTLIPRCDNRVRTRERRPRRQNISVAQFDFYTERVRHGFNNYHNLDFNGRTQKEVSLHNNLRKQEIHDVVPKSIVDSIRLYLPRNQE